MAVTPSSAILFGTSLLFAACAVFWPQIEKAYVKQFPGSGGSNSTKCPLGYEGPMPANHPPVMPTAAVATDKLAAGSQQQQWPSRSSKKPAANIEYKGPFVTYINGKIWTADPEIPWASSITVDITSGRIKSLQAANAAAGACSAESGTCSSEGSSSSSSSSDTMVDLQGAFVMPGIVDPHIHLIPSGLALNDLNLRHVSSRQDLIQRIAAAAAAKQAAAASDKAAAAAAAADVLWLVGGGWCEQDWGGELPDASWIDEVTGDIPTVLLRMDYHMAWVNSAAMKIAGFLKDRAYSEIVGIDRDAAGKPTGLLRESVAIDLVRQKVPVPTVEARRAALAAAGEYLLSRGITTVGDMGWGIFGAPGDTWNDLETVYDWAAAEGKLPVRVSTYVPLSFSKKLTWRINSQGDHHKSERLFWGGVKGFADGSLGSSTAHFWEPYNDSPTGNRGMRAVPQSELEHQMIEAATAGHQIAVHAIGDRALDEVLEVFEQLEECEPRPDGPTCQQHRVEHVQHISGAVSAAKMGLLGLMAVPNPQHLISDKEIMIAKLGAERAGAGRSHAYRTLADMDVSVAFASDWPVVDIDPFTSVYVAVYRSEVLPESDPPTSTTADSSSSDTAPQPQPPATSGAASTYKAWAPEERLPLDHVLLSHTATAAKAVRLDHLVGALQSGYKADFIVLDRSPFEGFQRGAGSSRGFQAGIPRVVKTYMDGACVYGCADAPAAAAV